MSKNNNTPVWPERTPEELEKRKKIDEAVKFLEEENFVVIFNKDKMIYEMTEDEFDLLLDLGYVNDHPQVRYYFRKVREMSSDMKEKYFKRIALLKQIKEVA